MNARNILFCLTICLSLLSCGTPKTVVSTAEVGPTVQTKFLGIEFGDSPNRIFRYYPLKNNDGSYTILNRDFGGYSWHYVNMNFVKKKLYRVNFKQDYQYESEANERFRELYGTLRTKYGEMEVLEDGNGFIYVDDNKNWVFLRAHFGTSRGGREFWYCDLTYCWGEGVFSYIQSIDDEI